MNTNEISFNSESSILSPKRKKTTIILASIIFGLFLIILISVLINTVDSSADEKLVNNILTIWLFTLFTLLFIFIYLIFEIIKFKEEPIFFQKINRIKFYIHLFLLSTIPFIILTGGILHYFYTDVPRDMANGFTGPWISIILAPLLLLPVYYFLTVIINFLTIAKYERVQKDKSWIRIVYSILLFTPPIILYYVIIAIVARY